MDALYSEVITSRGKQYKVEIVRGYVTSQEANPLCWVLYRHSSFGGWVKIPAMTRAECNAFPKEAAKIAQQILAKVEASRLLTNA
jgi:hypothetical protein